jgi:RHS repeat-associated protein
MTGLDYFGARYFSGAQGRFTSPDAPFADQHPEDPQSWNLYGYGRNNPLKYVDRTGRDANVSVEMDEKKKRGNITVKADLAVYANGDLNAKQGQRYADKWAGDIAKSWSGSFEQAGITYDVKVDVTATYYGSESDAVASGAGNVVELRTDIFDVDSAGNGTAGEVAARGLGYDGPDRWILTSAGSAGHEFGHALGVAHHDSDWLMSPGAPATQAGPGDYGAAFGAVVNRTRADQMVNMGQRGKPETFHLQARPIWWFGS